MATSKHLASSEFVKNIHEKLRQDSKVLGPDQAWKNHCEDAESLKKYATAMHDLAANHWENNYKSTKATSRVEWVHDFCQFYFSSELLRQRQREIEIASKINLEVPTHEETKKTLYKLLDVGSCYNPFKKYPSFEVLPIDIAPATSDVYKCDFLNVKIHSCDLVVNTNTEICELPLDSFDVVVFSLLLEYFPDPTQRLLCCSKAYNLLTPEGILVIITPDSKHVGANAKIMKSWRFILAKIGLSRIKYEKLAHLHCMVFRKSLKLKIAQRWALLQNEEQFYHDFVIPQDFKKKIDVLFEKEATGCNATLFNELPSSV